MALVRTFVTRVLFHCEDFSPLKFYYYVHGISSPPYGRSSEKRLDSVTLQLITLSLLKKMGRTLNIFHGRWPVVIPSLITAIAYLTLVLVGSLEHVNSSPAAAAYLSLYT